MLQVRAHCIGGPFQSINLSLPRWQPSHADSWTPLPPSDVSKLIQTELGKKKPIAVTVARRGRVENHPNSDLAPYHPNAAGDDDVEAMADSSSKKEVMAKKSPELVEDDEGPRPADYEGTDGPGTRAAKKMLPKVEVIGDGVGPAPEDYGNDFSKGAEKRPPLSTPPPRRMQNQTDAVPSRQFSWSAATGVPETDADRSSRPSLPELEATLVQSVDATLITEERRPHGDPVYDAVRVEVVDEPRTWWRRNQKYMIVGIGSLVIGAMAATIVMLVRGGTEDANGSANNSLDGSGQWQTMNPPTISPIGSTPGAGPEQIESTPPTPAAPDSQQTGSTAVPHDLASHPADATPAPPVASTTDETLTCAKHIGNLLEVDCNECYPRVALDGKEVVIGIERYGAQNTIIWMEYKNGSFETVKSHDIDTDIAAVAISGDTTVIGSPFGRDSIGNAHIYEKDMAGNWEEVATLTPDGLPGANFGSHVGIDGNLAVVVPNGEQSNSYVEHPAYVYRRVDGTWVEEDTINQAAESVSVKGNSIALGYRYDRSVSLYDQSSSPGYGWSRSHELSSADCGGGFGVSIAFEEEGGVFVGCPKDNSDTGAVYYYGLPHPSSMPQKILSSDGRSRDDFGDTDQISAASTEGKRLLAVGTYRNKNGGVYLYLFEDNRWSEVLKLDPIAGTKQFGDSVSMSADKLLVVSSARNVHAFSLGECFEANNILVSDGNATIPTV